MSKLFFFFSFFLQQHFLVKNVVAKNSQPALAAIRTDPQPSPPKLLSLFLRQLSEAAASYSLIDFNLESDRQQSEGDMFSCYIKTCSRISFYLSLFLPSNEPLSWII